MDELKRELKLLMLDLARAGDEETIKSEFLAGISRILGGIEATFLNDSAITDKTVISNAIADSGFGHLVIGCDRTQLPSGAMSILEDALYSLTLILKSRSMVVRDTESDEQAKLFMSRFEAICVGIVVHVEDGTIIYANEAACDILQIDYENYLPMFSPGPEWYVSLEDGNVLAGEQYPPSSILRSGKPIRNVITGVKAYGEDQLMWYSVSTEPHFNEQTSRLKEIIVTLVDVTALKHIEEALRVSEEKFAAAFRNSPDAININRVYDGLYIDVNDAFTNLMGYTREEVIGKSSVDLNIWHNPEDRAKLVRGLQERGEYLGLEAEFQRKNGDIGIGVMSARIITVEGDPCIISVTRDITEKRRAEEARRQFESQVEAQKRQFYRDTILSVTAGKLLIVDDADVEPYLASAEVVFDVRLPVDVNSSRRQVEDYFRKQGFEGSRLDEFMLAVGECITNAIKHGVYGRVYAGRTNGSVWAGIADKGKGIESLILPQAVLRQGFSTKPSLGLGYSIMLDASDSLMLKTGDTGTTVVLIRSIVEPVAFTGLSGIPDTWN